MSNAVAAVWTYIKANIEKRNPAIESDELAEYLEIIKSNASFLTSFRPAPQKFAISVLGQAIGFEMYYEPFLHVWKANLLDALGGDIARNLSLVSGINIIGGLNLQYRATNDADEIVEQELVLSGLFVTEPIGEDFGKYERGVESTKYAFSPDINGVCSCAIVYFTDRTASDLYSGLMNSGDRKSQVDLDSMDYQYEVI